MSGMKSAFEDFAVGAVGGLALALSRAIFGNNLLGAIAGPVMAGSVVKGARGTALATVSGYMMLAGANLGGGGAEAASDAGDM